MYISNLENICDVNLECYDNNKRDVNDSPSLKVSGKMYQIWRLKTKTFYEFLKENITSISRVQPYWQYKVFDNPIGQWIALYIYI